MRKLYSFCFLLTLLTAGSLSAQDCDCAITRVNNANVFSSGCAVPTDICSLTLGNGLNSINLEQFTDLRGVLITVGQNVNPTFSGAALTNNLTKFQINGGGINIRITNGTGGFVTFNSGAGNNPNGTNALNASLGECPESGTCTLFMPTVLPVSLLSWTATPTAKAIELKWKTTSEADNDHFRLLHGTNGRDFTEIARLTGSGTTEGTLSYRFEHFAPASGQNYYRLEQYDFDGSRTDLGLRTVNWTGATTGRELAVYPNPITAGQTLTIAGTTGTAQLIALTGRVVSTSRIGDNGSLVLPEGLAPGIYLLRAGERVVRMVVR